jgi:dynactin 1
MYTRAVGEDVYAILFNDAEDEQQKDPTWIDLQNTMFRTTERVLSMSESDIFGSITKDLRNLANLLVELASVAVDIDMTAECTHPLSPPSLILMWYMQSRNLPPPGSSAPKN